MSGTSDKLQLPGVKSLFLTFVDYGEIKEARLLGLQPYGPPV